MSLETLTITVLPSDGQLLEVAPVFRTLSSAGSPYRVDLDTAETYTLMVRHLPFNDLALTVHWDERESAWVYRTPTGDQSFRAEVPLELGRPIHFNTRPESVEVQTSDGTPLADVYGQVVLPHGWSAQTLNLVHPGFVPYRLDLAPGALDTPEMTWPAQPIALAPRFGVFSYWQFNVVAGLVVLALLAGVPAVRRLRRLMTSEPVPMRMPTLPPLPEPEPEPEAPVATSEKSGKNTFARFLVQLSGPGAPMPSGGSTLKVHDPDPFVDSLTWLQELNPTGRSGQVYKPFRCLGEGPEGLVFIAHGTGWVALKVMHETGGDAALRCTPVPHPCVVPASDWGEVEERPFVVRPLLNGQTLVDMAGPPQPLRQVLAWCKDLLEALGAAHSAGLTHGHLVAENILVGPRLQVMDFRGTGTVAEDLAAAGQVLETLAPRGPLRDLAAKIAAGQFATAAEALAAINAQYTPRSMSG